MKHKLAILGLIIMVLSLVGEGRVLAGGVESQKLIETKYLAGKTYFRNGDYKAAVKEFEEVIKLDPNYKVAQEYLKVAKEKAVAESEEISALQKRTEGLKEVIQKREESVAAREEGWRKWLAREEEKKKARQEKKKAAQEKNKELARLKREKELAHYYQLDELEKISQESQQMIAKAEKVKSLKEKEENQMWAKLEKLPSPKKEKAMARVYMAKAEAAYQEGNYDEAIKEWEKVNSVDPANTKARQSIEQVRRMIEKNKEAELNKAKSDSLAQASEAIRNYCKRGKFLYSRGDYKGSREEFQKALAIDPNSKPAQKGIVKAEKVIKAKELKEAKGRQRIAYKIAGLVNKGNRYIEGKKYSKARDLALKALEIDPNSPEAGELLRKAREGLGQK